MLEASGYASRPRDFDDLIRILDAELRLITPTDPEGSERRTTRRRAAGRTILPTHPRLSGPLPAGLADPQAAGDPPRAGGTAAGGTVGVLERQAREPPSAVRLEWANIRLLTEGADWTESQRRMMKRAGRLHGLRGCGLMILIGLGTWVGIVGYNSYEYHRVSAFSELLSRTNPTIFSFEDEYKDLGQQAIPMLQAEIARAREPTTDDNIAHKESYKDGQAAKQAKAAAALFRLGHANEVWQLLRHSAYFRLTELHRELALAIRGRPAGDCRRACSDRFSSARVPDSAEGAKGLQAPLPYPAGRGREWSKVG